MPKPTFFNLPADKRARIVEVAIDEFAEQTYAGASISRIVMRAGIAKGSFYQYFDGKIDLFRWLLYGEAVERKLAFLKDLPPIAVGDWWSTYAQMMLQGIRFGLANPKLSRLAVDAWYPSGDADLHALYAEMQAAGRTNLKALLEQGQRAGHVRTDLDLDLAAEMLLVQARSGLDLAIERKLGVDLLAFCAHPELAQRFPDQEQVALIEQVVDLLRRALGTGMAPKAGGVAIDLEELRLPLSRRQ